MPNTPPLTASNQVGFDKVVLQALMLGQSTDTFESQLRLILSLLKQDGTLSPVVPFAEQVFSRRVFNCSRVSVYRETMDSTFTLPTARLISANLSTLPNQLKIPVRPSDWGLKLSWGQWYVSPVLGPLNVGYAKSSLRFLFSENCPIQVNGSEGATMSGARACPGQGLTSLELTLTHYDSKRRIGEIEYLFPHGSTKDVYAFVSSQVPAEMVMYSTSLVFYGFHRIWLFTLAVMGWFELVIFFGFLGAVLYGLCKSCYQKRKRHMEGKSSTVYESVDQEKVNWYNCPKTKPARRVVFGHLGICSIHQVASAVAAIIGLIYNPSLAYLPWIAFMPSILVCILDVGLLTYLLSYLHGCRNRFQGPLRLFMGIFGVLSFAWMSVSMIALAITFTQSVGMGAHGVVYVLYLLTWLLRLLSWSKLAWMSWKL